MIDFSYIHKGQRYLLCYSWFPHFSRALDGNRAISNLQFGDPLRSIGAFSNTDVSRTCKFPRSGDRCKMATADKWAIVMDPAKNVDVSFGNKSPEGKKICFSVCNHRYRFSRSEYGLSGLGCINPSA